MLKNEDNGCEYYIDGKTPSVTIQIIIRFKCPHCLKFMVDEDAKAKQCSHTLYYTVKCPSCKRGYNVLKVLEHNMAIDPYVDKSLYLIFQWNNNKQAYDSVTYNGSGKKRPAFRQYTLAEVTSMHQHIISGIGKMLYKCQHCSTTTKIPIHIRDAHETVARFSHNKGPITNN